MTNERRRTIVQWLREDVDLLHRMALNAPTPAPDGLAHIDEEAAMIADFADELADEGFGAAEGCEVLRPMTDDEIRTVLLAQWRSA